METNPIALFVLLCGAVSVAIGVYAWRHRSTIGAKSFAALMFSMAVYILGYSMELASKEIGTMLFWSKIQYIGILTFPTIYLVFVIQYTRHEKLRSRRNISLLFLIPLALLVVKLFDDTLHLIYLSARVDTSGVIPLLAFTRGSLYLVVVVYNLLIVTFGNYLILQKWRFASSLYRKQTSLILAVAIILYLVYGIYLTGIPLFPGLEHLDLNPFIYLLWGFGIGFAIFRYRLFDLAPIARDSLIEMLSDGVIVLDVQARVVDANPEALKIFGWSQPPIGQTAEKLLNHWIDQGSLNMLEGSTKIETYLLNAGTTIYYEVTISPLKEKIGEKIGYLILVHDISGRKEAENKLQEMSLVDEMTGLTNRRGFKMLASQMIHMTDRMKLNAVLIYIDLDRLKWINDNLGHATGDQALIYTACILKNSFRTADIIARFGGDEFVILAIESVENTGETMLARLEGQLNAHNMQMSHGYQLSFSTGLARYEWENPTSIEFLLESADKAMYKNKQAKKG